ncbi:glutathione S-transferase family protein [Devosia sp.]|uniref:glutathione S-transferase family protein n=1 Tax=Devosia sp. TaxID=1871048 RepID=UPI002EE39816
MAKLRVLGRVTSINVRKVLWLLDEIGLEYEREDWGLPLRDPHEPEFLALNPNAQVPVIVDDGFVLWESNAVLRYLADKHGSALLPAEPQQRALVDQWLSWQASDLNGQSLYAFFALVRKVPGHDDETRVAASLRGWGAKLAVLERQLEKTDAFAAGADFSLADIALGLSVHRWFGTPFERPALPAVAAYYDRVRVRPAAAPYLTAEIP